MIRRLFKKVKKREPLQKIYWVATQSCNLECKYCTCIKKDLQFACDIEIEEFCRILDTIQKIANPQQVMIVFSGGEPLMRTDIVELGKEVVKRGFKWGIETNGFALTSELIRKLIVTGLNKIWISVNGMESVHNWYKGHAKSFENAMYGIKQFVNQGSSVDLEITTIVHAKNYDDLNLLHDMFVYLKVKNWRLLAINPNRDKFNAVLEQLRLSNFQFGQLLNSIKGWQRQKYLNIDLGCNGFLTSKEFGAIEHPFSCTTGYNSITIKNDGSVYRCPKIPNSPKIGNVFDDNFTQEWSRVFGTKDDKIKVCNGCSNEKLCMGCCLIKDV